MADEGVGPSSDAEALAAMKAALGVQEVPRKAPAKKAAKKAPAKKAAPRKQAAKKAPAKKVAKKASGKNPRKRVPRPDVPPEVIDPEIVGPAELALPDFNELISPQFRAHNLYLAGRPWEEIAQRTGYASAATASAAVYLWLQRGAIAAEMSTKQARADQAIGVTQAVKAAFFDRAMAGDTDAAKIVLKANEDFFAMAGLEKTDMTVNSRQTIVIGGGSDMGEQLRQAVAQADEERRLAEDGPSVTEVGGDVG